MLDRQLLKCDAQFLRPGARLFQGTLGENQRELFSAVAAGKISTSGEFAQVVAQFPEHSIPGIMAEQVVELFESVHIEHDDAQAPVFAKCIGHFALERFIQVAPVEQAREGIADGLVTQLLAQSEVGKRQSGLFRYGHTELHV